MADETRREAPLLVASGTNPGQLAGAIFKNWEEGKKVILTAIGAGAVNQAIKACAIARGFFAPVGQDMTLRIGFQDVTISANKRTAIRIEVVVA